MWESNNKHRAIVTDASNSKSGESDTNRSACGTTNTGTSTRLRIGVPGAEIWHSQETAQCRPHTDSNGGLAWYWESANPNLKLPTQRSGAVPWDSFRLQAEEDVK